MHTLTYVRTGLYCLMLLWSGFALGQDDTWDVLQSHVKEASPLTQRAASFLYEHRPERDAHIDSQILIESVELAIKARAEFPWAQTVPEDIFFNDVLPYAVLDETRESWRPDMLERCRPIVAKCTTTSEAAQALNRELFNLLSVHYNTGRKKPNQSPAESITQGRATCTGLSIILVDACRSVGVPARVAGVANWNDKRGNHTWVEIWDNGWHFLGADEYDAKGLNRGWFVGDASKAKAGSEEFAIWASSYKDTGRCFPLVWNLGDKTVHAVDVTARYAPIQAIEIATSDPSNGQGQDQVFIRVFDTRGGERLMAHVRVAGKEMSTAVITKAGTADLNDMPALALDNDERRTLLIEYEGYTRRYIIPAAHQGMQTLNLFWDELGLGKDEAESILSRVYLERLDSLRHESGANVEAGEFTIGDHTMKILEKSFGDEPADGRSLWISMHGGGGAPAEVNDRQWQNQIGLYEPDEGVYVAPRAPTDTWNLWHQAHIDDFIDELIESLIATRNVNPDRVYLMGYSAGGDGVFQLAPRMADRFAAAAMMAGHPNEAKPLGLRNLPFALLMGAEDSAYNRNTKAREWESALSELRQRDPDGYEHEIRIFEGLGHWMEKRDAEILPWMASQTRNAWPKRVVWHQDDVIHSRFYWLEVKEADAKARTTIDAVVDGQVISITAPDHLNAIKLRLRDILVDLDQPITVSVNNQVLFEGLVKRSVGAIWETMNERLDHRSAATAELVLEWKSSETP
jgi:predicted esterase